jgi:two-component system, OmpR family, response regulator
MPPMRRLLLIDDDEHLGPPLAAFFRRHGFELQHATTPSVGLAMLQNSAAGGGFDAAILDVMLPEMDGFELCRTIRRSAGAISTLPLLMLTARGDVMDRVVGLELGADDYLPKPFEPRELLARIQTVLRRTDAPTPAVPTADAAASATLGSLRFEGLLIDLDRRSVQVQGQAIELTSTEYELLLLLARTPGKVYSRDDILARLRGHAGQDIHSRAVDILVSRLRKKLEPLDVVHTLRHAGYLFAGLRV